MSDGELKLGDGLLLRGFSEHPTPTVKLNYGAPKAKGAYHLMMWLGIWSEGGMGSDERLNHLGWVFDPKAAAAAIEARTADLATQKEPPK